MSIELTDYEQKYEEFWKNIIEKDEIVNLDQVKRELYDFLNMMGEVSKVYCHVTDGAISKPNTSADVVIAMHDKARVKDIDEAIAELEELKTCDGCRFYTSRQGLRFCDYAWECKRMEKDRYKPKDNHVSMP